MKKSNKQIISEIFSESTLESDINLNIGVRLLILWLFSFLDFFCTFFALSFLWLCIKMSTYLLLMERGLCLFKGLRLLFFINFPGAKICSCQLTEDNKNSQKNMLSKVMIRWKQKRNCQIFHPKKVLLKIDEMLIFF